MHSHSLSICSGCTWTQTESPENILDVVPRVVSERYLVPAECLRIMLHYHPSYYHLHVHVINVDSLVAAGSVVGQAHLLWDVVDVLENGGVPDDYWEKRSLQVFLPTNHPLFEIIGGK